MPRTRRLGKSWLRSGASRRLRGPRDSCASPRTSSASSAPAISRRIGAASGGVEGARPALAAPPPGAGPLALPRQARAASNRYRLLAMTVRGPTAGAGRGGGRGRAALAALALAALACTRAPQPAAAWPPGALVAGSGRALAGLLAALARLEGTPPAREADAWAAALPGCEVVEGAAGTRRPAALRP